MKLANTLGNFLIFSGQPAKNLTARPNPAQKPCHGVQGSFCCGNAWETMTGRDFRGIPVAVADCRMQYNRYGPIANCIFSCSYNFRAILRRQVWLMYAQVIATMQFAMQPRKQLSVVNSLRNLQILNFFQRTDTDFHHRLRYGGKRSDLTRRREDAKGAEGGRSFRQAAENKRAGCVVPPPGSIWSRSGSQPTKMWRSCWFSFRFG